MKIAEIIPICLSAAIPGSGHIAAGKPARGLLIFFLLGFALDGWFYSQAQSILPAGAAAARADALRYGAIALAGILWTFAVVDTARLGLRRQRIAAHAEAADAHVHDALAAYLRDDLHAALRALKAARRINDQDPDVFFHLGLVLARMGQSRKARRAFYRCIRYDQGGKWDTQVQEQLRALEPQPPHAPAHPREPAEEPHP